MAFNREQQQVLSTIKKAGNGQKGYIKTYKSSPMGGGYVEVLSLHTYFAVSAMDGKDFSNPSLANGLFKLLIPAIKDDKSLLTDFNKLSTDKTIKFIFPDGREVGVINTKVTSPDGINPILARLYVGA